MRSELEKTAALLAVANEDKRKLQGELDVVRAQYTGIQALNAAQIAEALANARDASKGEVTEAFKNGMTFVKTMIADTRAMK